MRMRFMVLIAGWLVACPLAMANGWEHGAIKFEALVKALDSDDASLRATAIRSMGRRGDQRAVGHLLRHFARGEPDVTARTELYTAFGKLHTDKAANILARCARVEKRVEVRATCISALGNIPRKLAWAKLWSLHNEVPSIIEKSALVDAFGHFPFDASVDFLIKTAGGKNRSLARRAIVALGKTRSEKAAGFLLQRLKREKRLDVKLLLIKALGQLQAKAAAGPLAKIARQGRYDNVRLAATISLSAVKQGSSGPALIELLADPLPAVKFIALQSLGQLRYKPALPTIKKLSEDINMRLYGLRGDALLRDYVNVLGDLSVQVEALRALYEISPVDSADVFIANARPHPNLPDSHAVAYKIREGFYEQRRMALYGLGYSQADNAVDILRGPAGLQDGDPRLRLVAARSLGVLENKSALPDLVGALKDPNKDVRAMAAKVLGLWHNRASVPGLLRAAKDPMISVRAEVATALGLVGDRTARPTLEKLLSDKAAQVRKAAAFALELLK